LQVYAVSEALGLPVRSASVVCPCRPVSGRSVDPHVAFGTEVVQGLGVLFPPPHISRNGATRSNAVRTPAPEDRGVDEPDTNRFGMVESLS
jgi:hypothetical protein